MSGTYPRLRTMPNYPGPFVQLNGVEIPVAEWSVNHGDYGPLGPVSVSLRFEAEFVTEPEPETAEQRAERLLAEEKAELDALTAEWQSARNVHAGSPAVLAVLDLHYPRRPYTVVQCSHCEQSDGMESTENAPWPCDTYTALTSVTEQADGEAEARTLAPTEISITVQGGASREQLAEAVYTSLRQRGVNATTWAPFRR